MAFSIVVFRSPFRKAAARDGKKPPVPELPEGLPLPGMIVPEGREGANPNRHDLPVVPGVQPYPTDPRTAIRLTLHQT